VSLGLIADLWRFPVKSFGGERVRRVFVGPFGPMGDRRYALVDREGAAVSARRQTGLLRYRAEYADPEGADDVRVTTPDGRVVALDDPDLTSELSGVLKADVDFGRLPQGFHDAGAVHLVTLDSVSALGASVGEELDIRRFRANLVVELTIGRAFEEARWVYRTLRIGERLEIEVLVATERCVVTTVDPDTNARDKRVHQAIITERENFFGVYARVKRPGWVAVGDSIDFAE
jgi:uncharacterized protein